MVVIEAWKVWGIGTSCAMLGFLMGVWFCSRVLGGSLRA